MKNHILSVRLDDNNHQVLLDLKHKTGLTKTEIIDQLLSAIQRELVVISAKNTTIIKGKIYEKY